MRIQSAEFETSHTGISSCPEDDIPELAFIGRSNTGKSSLLNLLTRQRTLARVSQTPGCTQLINFFRINKGPRFVDLPGYGYAKVPKGGRAAFQQIIAEYIAHRPNLKIVFVLIDSRHEPQRIDLEFIEWLAEAGRPYAIAFTKTDKLKPAQAQKNATRFLEAIESAPPAAHFLTSSKTGTGRLELLGFIGGLAEVA
jgi:GTP-binding protein